MEEDSLWVGESLRLVVEDSCSRGGRRNRHNSSWNPWERVEGGKLQVLAAESWQERAEGRPEGLEEDCKIEAGHCFHNNTRCQ